MSDKLTYELDGPAARISMDDGKANVMSPAMLGEIHAAFDRANSDHAAVVVLRGRPGVFSGGFDLKIIQGGGYATVEMVRGGLELAERILSFPVPVIGVSTGHALAMGSFLLLSTDYRIGVNGTFRYAANEVAIGMTMPFAAVEMMRQRLTPAHFNRACILAEVFDPAGAAAAGFLDRVVDVEALDDAVDQMITTLAALDQRAHAATKLRARAQSLAALRAGIGADYDEMRRAAARTTH
ncbi:MAG: crotonase/enoyl-CoA hydratase family protein [Ilumatobacteraceae bacterium]|nr:crotonase/enoyl-CoA hydratase family protein [Ilumatobacteraceae bacterium]